MTQRPTLKLNAYLPPKAIPLAPLNWVGAKVYRADAHSMGLSFLTGPASGVAMSAYLNCAAPYTKVDRHNLEAWMTALGTWSDRFASLEEALAACAGRCVRAYVSRYKMREDDEHWFYQVEALRPVTDAEAAVMQAEHDRRALERGGAGLILSEKTLGVEAGLPTASQFDFQATDYEQPREWLYGKYVIRCELSVLVGDGGTGKSSFLNVSALAMASGKPLVGLTPEQGPMRVWLMSFEEDDKELRRRIQAAMRAHGLTPEDLGDRLHVSGKESRMCLATGGSGSVNIDHNAVNNLKRQVSIKGIDVLLVDPLIETHRVNELDNNGMQAVAKTWVNIATDGECGVFIAHHTRKSGGGEITVDDMRGAVAVKDTARIALELNPMLSKHADAFGLQSPKGYFSIRNGKSNFTALTEHRDWFQIASQNMGTPANPFGELVGVVKAWQPPTLRVAITSEQLAAVGAEIAKGHCRKDPQAKDYVGNTVAHVVGIRADDKPAMAGVKALIRRWLNDEALVINKRPDAKRELKEFVDLGNWSSAISSLGE
jgi:hypothetical protein